MRENNQTYLHIVAVLVFSYLIGSSIQAKTVTYNQAHTFFMPRALNTYGILAQRSNKVSDSSGSRLIISHTGFYTHSEEGKKLAPYFFGGDKSTLSVKQPKVSATHGDGDLAPDWFGVWGEHYTKNTSGTGYSKIEGTPYSSTLTINPERETVGMLFTVEQELSSLYPGMWARFVLPIMEVQQSLGLAEEGGIAHASSDKKNMIEALDNRNWTYGRLSSKKYKKTGIDDLVIQVGCDVNYSEVSSCSYHLEAFAPLGDKPTGRYLFEPIVGSSGHYGLGAGIANRLELFNSDDQGCWLETGLWYRYLFSATEKRTLDMIGKPFSRYLIYMDTLNPTGTKLVTVEGVNGVNYFTRDVLVSPGGTGESKMALVYKTGIHRGRIGYTSWWRQAERIEMSKGVTRTFAPAANEYPTKPWHTAPEINYFWIPGDSDSSPYPNNVTHTIELDTDSAAHQHAASYTLFADYAGEIKTEDFDVEVGAGLLYEITDARGALSNWGVWGRVSLVF